MLGSLVRVPRRRDLTLLSLGLVAGVLAQIVLGGITVLVDLHPAAVQGHMLLSLVLVANAVVLVHRASRARRRAWRCARCRPRSAATPSASPCSPRWPSSPAPSSPAPDRTPATRRPAASASRSPTRRASTARPSCSPWRRCWPSPGACGRRPTERAELAEWVSAWIFVALLQGAIGYIQYFNEVPALLVGIHVFGATVLWAVTVALVVADAAGAPGAPVADGARAAATVGDSLNRAGRSPEALEREPERAR